MCDCRVVANRNAFDAMLCELLIASRAIGNVFLLECVLELPNAELSPSAMRLLECLLSY